MNLGTTFGISLDSLATKVFDLTTARASVQYSKSLDMTNGNGVNQNDIRYSDNHTLAASGTKSYDLVGSLDDVFGDAINFAFMRGIIVHNKSADGISIEISGNLIEDLCGGVSGAKIVDLDGGGIFAWFSTYAGLPVTASTADTITITNLDGVENAEFDIIVLGISA